MNDINEENIDYPIEVKIKFEDNDDAIHYLSTDKMSCAIYDILEFMREKIKYGSNGHSEESNKLLENINEEILKILKDRGISDLFQ